MSDSMTKISEDIEEYEEDCRKLGVAVRYTRCTNGIFADCYSNHAAWASHRVQGKWLHIPEPALLKGIQFTYERKS